MTISDEPLLTQEAIAARVMELGKAIRRRHGDGGIVLLCVLKGGLFFTADLARALSGEVIIDVIRARSYEGIESSGKVTILTEPTTSLRGKHVVVIEDILDTGRTARVLLERVRKEEPADLALCTLIDKPSRRVEPIEADFVGFTIDDCFVVGYGLDWNERYRALPAVYVLNPDISPASS